LGANGVELGLELCVFCSAFGGIRVFLDCCAEFGYAWFYHCGVESKPSGGLTGIANSDMGQFCRVFKFYNLDFELDERFATY